ncbi:MAG: RNA methyltransferase [Verrucomicrobia bacterium]|nr:MAG: RNA methyltransferase [Verrucomicrobiota bacterium]
MSVESITSLQNPRIKNLVRLRDRRPRDKQKVFPVEGFRAIRRALEQRVPILELYYAPDWFLGTNETEVIDRVAASGARLFELSKPVFAKIAYRDRPEGLLAMVDQWETTLSDLKLGTPPFLLVVESIEKPGNLGTILRSADAAGVDAVIVCDPVTDLFNPNVVRSSTGVLFAVDVAVAPSKTVLEWLRERKIRIAATTPHTRNVYTRADLTGPLAIVMGSEQHGLSGTWLDACDQPIRIPMAGQADSLNVAMATLVTLFEAVRQRGTDAY